MAGAVDFASGVSIQGSGRLSTILTKAGGAGPITGAFFRGASGASQGYGAGASDFRVSNMTFRGSFSQSRTSALAQLHHSRNVVFSNITADELMGGGHVLDLMGCDGITVEDFIVLGCNTGTTRRFSEAIQIDYSTAVGASIPDNFAGFDGLPTINVRVSESKFLPKVVGGTTYPAPNPLGTHGVVEGRRPRNIVFTENLVRGWFPDVTSSTHGVIHFAGGVDNLEVSENFFENTDAAPSPILRIYRGAFGYLLADVQNPSAASVPLNNPVVGSGYTFSENVIEGINSPTTNQTLLTIQGDADTTSLQKDLVILGNIFRCSGVITIMTLSLIEGAVVSSNVFRGRTGLFLSNTTGLTISGNSYVGLTTEVSLSGVQTNLRRFDAAP